VSARLVIVDGYNVILRSPSMRPNEGRTLRQAREKLVNMLSWVVGGEEARFVVVFDGAHVAGPPEKSGRVEVRFSRQPATADDVIRELVEKALENEQHVTVVTADLEVARHARAMGADIALSDLFLASVLGPAAREAGEAPEKPSALSKKEVEEWAEMFRNRTDDSDPVH
jgi:predicted RNA-binding protein with PIN domain